MQTLRITKSKTGGGGSEHSQARILITSVVQEREARLREGMRMMGHPSACIITPVRPQATKCQQGFSIAKMMGLNQYGNDVKSCLVLSCPVACASALVRDVRAR
eukprot:6469502-Amphidinium_carterae.1